MKILSLNIWGGTVYEPLLQFIKTQADFIDIFCLQEVFSSEKEFVEPTTGATHHILQHLADLLPNHQPYFFPAQEGPGMDANIYPDIQYGLAFFIKKPRVPLEVGDIFVYGQRNSYLSGESFSNLPRNLAYMTIKLNGEHITIYNFHGLWTGGGKGDTDSRIEQSMTVKQFIDGRPGKTILCGDFNLLPTTQSLAILEDGLINLITANKITSTRTSLYTKEPKFADYMLISPEIQVDEFKVLPDEVSDHSPLYLEFDAEN